MEHFGADPELAPSAKIREEVKRADLFIGVFGMKYGYIDQATGLSMTELEFREALSNKKPMFVYVINPEAKVKVSDIETSIEGREKLDKLKKELMKNHTVYLFMDSEDLGRQVFEDLKKYISKSPTLSQIKRNNI